MSTLDRIPPEPGFEEGFLYKIVLGDVKKGPEGSEQEKDIEMKIEVWHDGDEWRAKASGLDDKKIAWGKGADTDQAIGAMLGAMVADGYTLVLPQATDERWQRKESKSGEGGVEVRG